MYGQRQTNGFLKNPLQKKAGDLLNLSRHQLSIVTGLLTAHCHLQGEPFKLGLVNSPEQASEIALHVLCVCKTLATLRFRHPGRHVVRPGDFEDVSVSKVRDC
jgi:hypothetical protein